jgi:transcriptional regulator with XRE-family HTH domain
MQITSDQCRAARSLLNWTQEELATNARVSRATVADFESNSRQPMKNNAIAMEDSMYAAGVEFLREEGDAGVGVRFREQKLEYTKNVRVNRFDGRATMQMRYGGSPFECVIDLNAIDDVNGANYQTDEEFGAAISELQGRILAAVERQAKLGIEDGRVNVTYEMLDPRQR